jgi:hypothetical protein
MPRGEAYTIDSPPWNAMVTHELARALEPVLERFARDAGFTRERPVEIHFEPGVVGHHQSGRAADIYQVQRKRLDVWKDEWDTAKHRDLAGAKRRNLGWRLYRALAHYGRWAQPPGMPVQLFGPWTREEGPHFEISERLLQAHRDHIHLAR